MVGELQAGDPRTAGPYRLVGRLGAGGMGQVYLARSPGGRAVAVKVIRPELAEEDGFRDRFAREIAAARGVNGVFTAAVIDADPEAAVPWMATAYVAGPSLAAAVSERGPLPVASVLALAAGLAEGLAAIHAAGLVHRDLKPSNVLLAADGPRVIDFGISRAAERSMLTTAGMLLGSPGFMSPEQAMGRITVGRPSDIFSLGAVLAFAASGDSPFGTGPVPTLMYRVVHEAPDLSRVPRELWPLLEWCMAKDPAGRPTTGDLLRELSPAVDSLGSGRLPGAVAAEIGRDFPAAAGQTGHASQAQTVRRDGTRPTAATVRRAPAPAGSSPAVPGAWSGTDTGADTGTVPSRPAGEDGGRTAGPALGGPRPPRRRGLVLAAVGAAGTAVAVVAALLLSSPGQATPGSVTSSTATSSMATAHATASPSGTHSRVAGTGTAKPAQPATAAPVQQAPVTPSVQQSVVTAATHHGSEQQAAHPPESNCSYDQQTGENDLCSVCNYDTADSQYDICTAPSQVPSSCSFDIYTGQYDICSGSSSSTAATCQYQGDPACDGPTPSQEPSQSPGGP